MSRYLTDSIPGTGGLFKETDEDFLVTEIPAYLPCGEGEHLYVEIEKRGITTLEAIRRIGRALNLPEREIGYAGMKDSRGITRQTLSLPRIRPEAALGLDLPGIRMHNAAFHRNKLKLGHLRGNRFRLQVRDVNEGAFGHASAVLAVLEQRGVPNYFGSQRYGGQGNSQLIGRALVRQDYRGAVDTLMGDPAAITDQRWREAVEAYHRGEFAEAVRHFPGFCRTEREVAGRLVRRPDAFDKAFDAVNPRLKKLYLSALQSWLFDRLLDERLPTFDQVEEGDLAFRHHNGACFLVTDAAVEAPRAARQEISPTGPLFGCKMTPPAGAQREREERLLEAEGLSLEQFNLPGGLRMEGERRPFRILLGEPALELEGNDLILSFSLPKGSYATNVLGEVMKAG
jgi:tRNA pseudouridine13 synthase